MKFPLSPLTSEPPGAAGQLWAPEHSPSTQHLQQLCDLSSKGILGGSQSQAEQSALAHRGQAGSPNPRPHF